METGATGRHLLLISYIFPPYPGIGGRRWAKHAISLVRNGFRVDVIAARNPFGIESVWTREIKNTEGITVHELPSLYPGILLRRPESIREKLAYKFWDKLLPIISKGSIYDPAIFWKGVMISKAEELIKKKNINTVIVTGAPFRVPFYATTLKKRNPELLLVTDLRDPWTWGQGYGLTTISRKRLEFEKYMESEVVSKSDLISVPSAKMIEHLARKYPDLEEKFYHLPHAFDPANVTSSTRENKVSGQVNLIYFGSQYDYVESWWEKLAETFKLLPEARFHLDVYSENERYKYVFEQHGVTDRVDFHEPIASADLFNKLKQYDFVLFVYPDYAKDHMTTKFYEVIANRIPILLIGNAGDVTSFISSNKLGVCIQPENIGKVLPDVLNDQYPVHYNNSFDISSYTFDTVTAIFLQKLTTLK